MFLIFTLVPTSQNLPEIVAHIYLRLRIWGKCRKAYTANNDILQTNLSEYCSYMLVLTAVLETDDGTLYEPRSTVANSGNVSSISIFSAVKWP